VKFGYWQSVICYWQSRRSGAGAVKKDFCSFHISARICEPMPLEPPDLKFYEAACGFLQLGMALDANAELDKIDPFNRAAPEVLALKCTARAQFPALDQAIHTEVINAQEISSFSK
jgi:hypothetical protein